MMILVKTSSKNRAAPEKNSPIPEKFSAPDKTLLLSRTQAMTPAAETLSLRTTTPYSSGTTLTGLHIPGTGRPGREILPSPALFSSSPEANMQDAGRHGMT